MPKASAVSRLIAMTEKFLAEHQGQWTHEDWEAFAAEVGELGYACEQDECRRNLGNILEGLKYFYHKAPESAVPSSEKPKTKAPAKAKVKAPAKKKTVSKKTS